MPEHRPPLACPRCGTTMNHHANKLVEPCTPADDRDVDAALGGVLEEAYACPRCGNVESRQLRPSSM